MKDGTKLLLSLDDLKKKIKKYYAEVWKDSWIWATYKYPKLDLEPGSYPDYFFLKIRDHICITRLLLRSCRFTKEHFFKKREPKTMH